MPSHISARILRHTTCTRLTESGLEPKVLQYIMGHANVSITPDVYTHPDFTQIRKNGGCAEKYDDRINTGRCREYYSGSGSFFTKGTEKVQNIRNKKMTRGENLYLPYSSQLFHTKLALMS